MATVIDHLWQSTLVAAGVALLLVLLRRNGAHVRYWVWFTASVKFLIPFAALVSLGAAFRSGRGGAPAFESDWTVLVERVTQPMSTLTSSDAFASVVAEPVVRDGGITIAAVAIGVWLLGIVGVLGVWLSRWLRLRRVVLDAKPLSIAGVSGRIEVKATSLSIEPGVFGIVKPVLLVPTGVLERLTAPQLHAVIAHEMCHVQRRDNLTAAVHMLVETLFWFHPLVWWIGARLLEERERACDEAVIAAGVEPNAYAEGILEVGRQCIESPLPCAAGVGAGGALKARVERIVDRCAVRPLSMLSRSVLAASLAAVLGLPIVIGAVYAPALSAQAVPDLATTELLDRYVGYYGIPEIDWIVRIERDGDHLVVQENARMPLQVYPRSETEFVARDVDAEIEFDEANGTRVLLLRRGGDQRRPIWGPSIDAAIGQARLDALGGRVDAQTPAPGAEAAARRIARVLAGEEALPAEDGAFDPARAVLDGLMRNLPDAFAQRGELNAVSFESVNRLGNAVYEIDFENLTIDVMIGMRDESTVASLNYRVASLPDLLVR